MPGVVYTLNGTADSISYDNSQSLLSGDNIQDAIDEVTEELSTKATINNSFVYSDLDIADEGGHIIARFENGHFKTKEFDSENISNRVIRILIYGNSWAGGAVSYAGAILDEILNSDAKVHIGFCYQGNSSLQNHYDNAISNSNYNWFYWNSDNNDWIKGISISFNDALYYEDWDIVLLQQLSGSAGTANTYEHLNDLIDIISSRASKPVKFGWILARDKFDSSKNYSIVPIWENAMNIAQSLLNKTLIDFVIPTGTATENARTTTLNNLGTVGLTQDGTHLQDGVPCLVEAYCFALSVLNVYGFGSKSINGSKFIPGETIQPHGSVVGVTDNNNIKLAQKCAIFAFKKPFEITQVENLSIIESTNTGN